MDVLTFIANMTKAIAWPIVVVIFLYMVRNRLGNLIDAIATRLIKAKLPGGIEFEFAQKLEEASDSSEQLAIEKNLTSTASLEVQQTPEEQQYLALARVSPESAILQAYKMVEASILENAQEFPMIRTQNLSKYIEQLHNGKLIDDKVVDQFKRIREIRNLVVHAGKQFTPSVAEALEYRSICVTMDKLFRFIFAQLNHARQPVE